ncbi:hypothetical protein VTN02DRAFT_311 [Thermoascus thermophilus]
MISSQLRRRSSGRWSSARQGAIILKVGGVHISGVKLRGRVSCEAAGVGPNNGECGDGYTEWECFCWLLYDRQVIDFFMCYISIIICAGQGSTGLVGIGVHWDDYDSRTRRDSTCTFQLGRYPTAEEGTSERRTRERGDLSAANTQLLLHPGRMQTDASGAVRRNVRFQLARLPDFLPWNGEHGSGTMLGLDDDADRERRETRQDL